MATSFSPAMQVTLKTALNLRNSYAMSGWGVLHAANARVGTIVALLDRGALVVLGSNRWGVTRTGAEVVGVDYDLLIEQAHELALEMNAAMRRCPLVGEGCDFVAFGRPATPFGNHREITSDDQMIYHINQLHMGDSAHYLGHIGMLTDEVRRDVADFVKAYRQAKAYVAPVDDERPAASVYAVDVPVDYERCARPEPHGPHAWSFLGPAVSHFCGGHKLAETHVALPVLHGPIADEHGAELVDESPSFFAGAAPVRTYADGCQGVGPYPSLRHNLDGYVSGIFTSHTLDANA